jgi:hypothetical protein
VTGWVNPLFEPERDESARGRPHLP